MLCNIQDDADLCYFYTWFALSISCSVENEPYLQLKCVITVAISFMAEWLPIFPKDSGKEARPNLKPETHMLYVINVTHSHRPSTTHKTYLVINAI